MAPDSEGTTTGAITVVDGVLITGIEARNVLPNRSSDLGGLVGKTNGLYDISEVHICCTFCDLLLFLGPPKKPKRPTDWYVARGTKRR